MKFLTINRQEVGNIVEYIIDQRLNNSNLKIHIGCDSIVTGGNTYYITTIAFRYKQSGAHFIYNKEKVANYRKSNGKPDIFTRLWQEGRNTIELANSIIEKSNGFLNHSDFYLEFDYNFVLKTISNQLIPSITGWAVGIGYNNIILKNGDQVACKAANQICQHC